MMEWISTQTSAHLGPRKSSIFPLHHFEENTHLEPWWNGYRPKHRHIWAPENLPYFHYIILKRTHIWNHDGMDIDPNIGTFGPQKIFHTSITSFWREHTFGTMMEWISTQTSAHLGPRKSSILPLHHFEENTHLEPWWNGYRPKHRQKAPRSGAMNGTGTWQWRKVTQPQILGATSQNKSRLLQTDEPNSHNLCFVQSTLRESQRTWIHINMTAFFSRTKPWKLSWPMIGSVTPGSPSIRRNGTLVGMFFFIHPCLIHPNENDLNNSLTLAALRNQRTSHKW